MKRWKFSATLAFLFMVIACPAHAHLVETGFGDFYDGIAHVAVTPADLLVVIALALFAGLRGTRAARYAIFALPLSWLVGGMMGANESAETTLPLLTTLTFAVAGALVALDAKVHDTAIIALVVISGALHGFDNGASMFGAGYGMLALMGAVCAVLVVTVILAAEVTALPIGWPRITVRVAGSWIVATGMLMFGWLVHSAA